MAERLCPRSQHRSVSDPDRNTVQCSSYYIMQLLFETKWMTANALQTFKINDTKIHICLRLKWEEKKSRANSNCREN